MDGEQAANLPPHLTPMLCSVGKTDRLRHAICMSARQMGKTFLHMEQSVRGASATMVAFDDLLCGLEPLPEKPKFSRGLQKQEPPVAAKPEKCPPGHVMVRDRTGKLVMRKIGRG